MDGSSPWWAWVIHAVVIGVVGAWLDYRNRRRTENLRAAVDDNTAKTEEVKATAKATYETVNGEGLTGAVKRLTGWAHQHEVDDKERHQQNIARLESIEDAVLGKRKS